MMPKGIMGWVKLVVALVVIFFVVKVGMAYVANKFPNKVTNAANKVIQAA